MTTGIGTLTRRSIAYSMQSSQLIIKQNTFAFFNPLILAPIWYLHLYYFFLLQESVISDIYFY